MKIEFIVNKNHHGHYVACKLYDGESVRCAHLHKDGVWRRQTVAESGEYTGYFDSEAKALAAANAWFDAMYGYEA